MSETNEMKIRSIAPWFGGKRTLAPRIIHQLGPHSQYFEPFYGSMAVLLAKPVSSQETVNDLHDELVNLAQVLQSEGLAEKLYDRLQATLFHEALLDQARHYLESNAPEHTDWVRAYWYFLSCWMQKNGVAGTARSDFQMAVRWTKGGGSPTIRFRSAVDSLPAWHNRLRNVVILQRDAFDILPKFEDAAHTVIYVDAPYTADARSRSRNRGGEGCYLHDFKDGHDPLFGGGDDHSRLADILHNFTRARIVVSYYDSPRIRELYNGWNFLSVAMPKNLANAQSAPVEAPEVLIVNGPLRGEQ